MRIAELKGAELVASTKLKGWSETQWKTAGGRRSGAVRTLDSLAGLAVASRDFCRSNRSVIEGGRKS